ncbi:MGH1-like glycoside hydrolase domain-containing protein [Mucilaginibacter pedocola]|uniref:mannosyl-oligosaccharide glucosidase n=1 Tax=Mucilaginibacter pedocola TaxID=1792845 RepID=A0A1S9PKM3_9SPHI|nr:glucosidase [Mucilaginibacter pedocola]OOQ61485.1 glucosidase [Mucilaginibacter pedocola]
MENIRLSESHNDKNWKQWGPYLAERQWGTVREDYSQNGNTWDYINHDLARSYAYRWGEEGIGGFCDSEQVLCLAPAFWNGNDTILKERLFGLTNNEGNHGEDVKELYFHLDSSPTHSYCKFLYKYPQKAYPYMPLLENNRRDRLSPEFEILDTDAFKDGRYFDCYIEYAKAGVKDILMKITVHNRAAEAATIHVLPHLWFRNFWRHNPRFSKPGMAVVSEGCIQTTSTRNGAYYFYHQGGEQLFCENETNSQRIFHKENDTPFVKDGINNYVVNGEPTVNPEKKGTKAAVWLKAEIEAGGSKTFKIRLSRGKTELPWEDFDEVLESRLTETDEYYKNLAPKKLQPNQQQLLRSAVGGLLWTKQFYYFDIFKWLFGEPNDPTPPRNFKRNYDWQHLTCRNIISMPDKWEYPWFAAWDLAFHAASFVHVDPVFAKQQLLVVLREYYMHPNGQIPAYEWNFSDVNPPVHAWGVWYCFEADRKKTGKADWDFLERAFQKLLMNFTWWVNQKDANGTDIFEGGFLGLDNIGVFDRNHMPPGIKKLQQADATSWMAMYAINMLRISLELAQHNIAYEESAAKFFRHFLNIGWAMQRMGKTDISLWDEEDGFYYDAIQFENGASQRLKIRSLVGIIPLLAVEIMPADIFSKLREFNNRLSSIKLTRPDLTKVISDIDKKNADGNYLFALMIGDRLEQLLKRLLDEDEFLSDYGIRSLSKYYQDKPFVFGYQGAEFRIQYEPGESSSAMFGGNSNWRGPIWMPINYLIINALRKYHEYYGDSYTYEFPARSGNKLTLKQIANELTKRLLKIFERDADGAYQYHSSTQKEWSGEHFKDHHLFYEFFHGDNGQGLGASHQTGWTALFANLLLEMDE